MGGFLSTIGHFLDPGMLGDQLKATAKATGLIKKTVDQGSQPGDQIDPSLSPQLMAYYNSEPSFAAAYMSGVNAGTEHRTAEQWMYDHIASHPDDQAKFTAFINSPAGQNATGGIPLEQSLLQTALPELQGQISRDAGRQTIADALQAMNSGDTATYQALMDKLQSGQLLTDQNANADRTGTSLVGNAGAAAAGDRAASTTQNAALLAAADPLFKSRLDAAEQQVTGVNLGLQGALDQLTADRAAQGYVGGSTMDDAAVARAGIGARQAAAGLVGQANVSNAGDTASINALDANQNFGISHALDQQTQLAMDNAAKQKSSYFDAQYPAQVGAALSVPGFTQGIIGSNMAGDTYSTSGLNNALGTLNWWNTNQQAAPTPGAVATQASNTGNQISALGTGLLGAALNNSSWWKPTATPTTTTTTTAIPQTGPGSAYGDLSDYMSSFYNTPGGP